MNKEVVGQIDFRYRIDDIYEEVYKRTSFLSKYRGDDENPHQLNKGSFTRDEKFMFVPFLEEGAAKVFDVLDSFTHGLEEAYGVDEYASAMITEVPYLPPLQGLVSASYISEERNGNDLTVRLRLDCYPSGYNPVGGIAINGDIHLKYTVKNSLGLEEIRTSTATISFLFKDSRTASVSFVIDVDELDTGNGVPPEEYIGVKSFSVAAHYGGNLLTKLPVSSIVKMLTLDGTSSTFYVVRKSISLSDYMECGCGLEELPADAFGCVRFTINKMEWLNQPAIRAAYNAIHNALINYVIYRWFLYTLPSEAKMYIDAFEQCTADIQRRLNSQSKPVRRNYNYF